MDVKEISETKAPERIDGHFYTLLDVLFRVFLRIEGHLSSFSLLFYVDSKLLLFHLLIFTCYIQEKYIYLYAVLVWLENKPWELLLPEVSLSGFTSELLQPIRANDARSRINNSE